LLGSPAKRNVPIGISFDCYALLRINFELIIKKIIFEKYLNIYNIKAVNNDKKK